MDTKCENTITFVLNSFKEDGKNKGHETVIKLTDNVFLEQKPNLIQQKRATIELPQMIAHDQKSNWRNCFEGVGYCFLAILINLFLAIILLVVMALVVVFFFKIGFVEWFVCNVRS